MLRNTDVPYGFSSSGFHAAKRIRFCLGKIFTSASCHCPNAKSIGELPSCT